MEACEEFCEEVVKDGTGHSRQDEKRLKEEAKKGLKDKADKKEKKLQTEATDTLEKELQGIKKEIDQTVNRVTAEALKIKAAQLGQIKELTEDPEQGSMTIVVEV